MKYPLADELPDLIERKLVTRRFHPLFPLSIYNYTVGAQMTPLSEWTEAMKDCRGLILDREGGIVARPFRKFWNVEQVQDQIPPNEPFNVWEKLDGSLGIACAYAGEVIAATRGSFESEQAKWFDGWLKRKHKHFTPSGETFLFEIIYAANRIVVDYGTREEAVLLSVMSPDGADLWQQFDADNRFNKARRFDGIADFSTINTDSRFCGEEGFVLQWESGFRAKVKLDEYKRLHRLITQCSTRTIWDLLKSGSGIQELVDRVPAEFAAWVTDQAKAIEQIKSLADFEAHRLIECNRDRFPIRKDFALWAKGQPNPSLLFSLLDGKDITDACWKLAEPKWSTPFRKEPE